MSDEIEEQRIPIILCEAGMELSRPVSDGTIHLCGAGTVLSDRLIAQLSVRRVERVWVKGHPLPVPSERPLDEQIDLLRQRFSRSKHQPTMAIIERAIEQCLARVH